MRKLFIIIVLLPTFLIAQQKRKVHHDGAETPFIPWMTGSLFAPTPVNPELGHPAIQPSLAIFTTYGLYNDSWSVSSISNILSYNPVVDFQFATTERTGVEVIGAYITNCQDGMSASNFQDTIVNLGYQVSTDVKDSWVPDFRFLFEILFPTGNHHRLKASLNGLDLTGQGAYFFGPNLSFQKLFYLEKHFFMLHWSIGYFFPTKASVRGLNNYGGAKNTKGEIRPGQALTAFLSGEYSLDKHWVLAFDTQLLYQRESGQFSGRAGTLPDGRPAPIGLPSNFQLSFAPQIEYNFSANSGLLIGGWATIAGRNSEAFAGGFIAYLYIF